MTFAANNNRLLVDSVITLETSGAGWFWCSPTSGFTPLAGSATPLLQLGSLDGVWLEGGGGLCVSVSRASDNKNTLMLRGTHYEDMVIPEFVVINDVACVINSSLIQSTTLNRVALQSSVANGFPLPGAGVPFRLRFIPHTAHKILNYGGSQDPTYWSSTDPYFPGATSNPGLLSITTKVAGHRGLQCKTGVASYFTVSGEMGTYWVTFRVPIASMPGGVDNASFVTSVQVGTGPVIAVSSTLLTGPAAGYRQFSYTGSTDPVGGNTRDIKFL